MASVYLDNNATTRVDPRVVQAMLPSFTECYGNAASTHGPGAAAARAVRGARQQVQALLGAPSEHDVAFTSGATESIHWALQAAVALRPGRDEVVVSAVEHPAVLASCAHLARSQGLTVRTVPVDGRGRLDLAAYRRALTERTALASVMWANNETGTVFQVVSLAALAHEVGALFHTDAVQAAGRVPVRLQGTPIDLLSLSGHKLHGPKGVGALYARSGLRLPPLFRGGRQERGRRAGTENVPGIVGLGRAAALALEHLDEEATRVRELRDRLEEALLERLEGCHVEGDATSRLGNTSCLTIEGVDGEELLVGLDRAGIAASSGSACASGHSEPSHVLRAMRVPPGRLGGALRLSFSRDSSPADAARVLEVLPPLVQALRAVRAAPPPSAWADDGASA